MRVVALNGSPRKNGRLARVVEEILAGAGEAGHDCETIHLADLEVRDCTGCMKCQEEGEGLCVIRDDIEVVEGAIRRADLLVLAGPVHWGNLSAIALRTFERLFGFLIREQPRGMPRKRNAAGKRAVLVTACSTGRPFNWIFNQSRAVFSRFREICRYSGIKITHKFVLPGTITMAEVPAKHLRRARKLGRSLG